MTFFPPTHYHFILTITATTGHFAQYNGVKFDSKLSKREISGFLLVMYSLVRTEDFTKTFQCTIDNKPVADLYGTYVAKYDLSRDDHKRFKSSKHYFLSITNWTDNNREVNQPKSEWSPCYYKKNKEVRDGVLLACSFCEFGFTEIYAN